MIGLLCVCCIMQLDDNSSWVLVLTYAHYRDHYPFWSFIVRRKEHMANLHEGDEVRSGKKLLRNIQSFKLSGLEYHMFISATHLNKARDRSTDRVWNADIHILVNSPGRHKHVAKFARPNASNESSHLAMPKKPHRNTFPSRYTQRSLLAVAFKINLHPYPLRRLQSRCPTPRPQRSAVHYLSSFDLRLHWCHIGSHRGHPLSQALHH